VSRPASRPPLQQRDRLADGAGERAQRGAAGARCAELLGELELFAREAVRLRALAERDERLDRLDAPAR
jgi:hypothetical protein